MRFNPEPSARPEPVWLHRFAAATAVCTLVLILVGGLVTSHGVGMAVPDWPNTYGYNMFLFPFSHWIGGVFYEHTHRLVAALVGLMTTVMAVWLWVRETRGPRRWIGVLVIMAVISLMGIRQMPVYLALAGAAPLVMIWSAWRLKAEPGQLRWWGVMALACVILQGVLGGLRVVWIADQIGIFHGTLAQLFFVLVCLITLFTSRFWRLASESAERRVQSAEPEWVPAALSRVLLGGTLLILLQLVLGATMRHQHAGLAISDFPLAHGRLWPATDAASIEIYNQRRLEVIAVKPIAAGHIYLQMAHRAVAVLVLGTVVFAAWSARRSLGGRHPLARLALAWVGLITVQILLGAWTIWSNKAADVATLHVLVGSFSLALGAMTSILAFRFPVSVLATAPASSLAQDRHGVPLFQKPGIVSK